MTETQSSLKDILGEERLKEIAQQEQVGDELNLINSKEIHCHCKTIILKPNHAKLIVPSDFMLEMEKDLMFLQRSDTFFKDLVRGCYWLVDDMYKFEQMGYTKEIHVDKQKGDEGQEVKEDDNQQSSKASAPHGLRYLLCAECNLCPLGWFNPETKESYLYVW